MDAQKLILRGGAAAGLGYIIRFGARLLFLFVAARLFGVALFGAYSLAVAAVELAVAIGGLGMKRYLFKLLDEGREERAGAHVLLDAVLLVGAVSMLLAALLASAALLAPSAWLERNTATALLLIAPMVAGQALLDLFLAATRWRRLMRYEVAARSIVEPYAGIIAAIAAWAAGLSETGLVLSYWAGTLSGLVYAAYGARMSFGGFGLRSYRPGPLRKILRDVSAPTATDGAAALFARLDLYLVGGLLGEAPAGIYNMARQLRTPIRQVRQSLDGLLTPVLANTLTAAGELQAGAATASAGRLILAIQLPIVVGLAAIGLPLLGWLGPEFAAGYWAMLVLALAETALGAFGVSELILLYRRPWLTFWIIAASATANVLLALALIGPLGFEGVALATFAAICLGAALRRAALRSIFGIEVPITHSAGPILAFLAAATAVLAVLLLPQAGAPALIHGAALAAGFLVYAGSLRLWLAVSGETLSLRHLKA